jgi:hypothetical protein
MLVQIVEYDFGIAVAFGLDDDAHAVAIALVADIGNAVNFSSLDKLDNFLDQIGLVDLIREAR